MDADASKPQPCAAGMGARGLCWNGWKARTKERRCCRGPRVPPGTESGREGGLLDPNRKNPPTDEEQAAWSLSTVIYALRPRS